MYSINYTYNVTLSYSHKISQIHVFFRISSCNLFYRLIVEISRLIKLHWKYLVFVFDVIIGNIKVGHFHFYMQIIVFNSSSIYILHNTTQNYLIVIIINILQIIYIAQNEMQCQSFMLKTNIP